MKSVFSVFTNTDCRTNRGASSTCVDFSEKNGMGIAMAMSILLFLPMILLRLCLRILSTLSLLIPRKNRVRDKIASSPRVASATA